MVATLKRHGPWPTTGAPPGPTTPPSSSSGDAGSPDLPDPFAVGLDTSLLAADEPAVDEPAADEPAAD
ncbi:MAG TPA: hypothetical protein VFD36_22910, partial [Kofleriaceae bacterium]|nr:hypothetical protein [Kofleriaceae bacterium]